MRTQAAAPAEQLPPASKAKATAAPGRARVRSRQQTSDAVLDPQPALRPGAQVHLQRPQSTAAAAGRSLRSRQQQAAAVAQAETPLADPPAAVTGAGKKRKAGTEPAETAAPASANQGRPQRVRRATVRA
jgi:hypothetical protein